MFYVLNHCVMWREGLRQGAFTWLHWWALARKPASGLATRDNDGTLIRVPWFHACCWYVLMQSSMHTADANSDARWWWSCTHARCWCIHPCMLMMHACTHPDPSKVLSFHSYFNVRDHVPDTYEWQYKGINIQTMNMNSIIQYPIATTHIIACIHQNNMILYYWRKKT